MVFDSNEFDHNIGYGFDPHDFTHDVVVENNQSHDNGTHGFIISCWLQQHHVHQQ